MWAPYVTENHWPDADMLPIGKLRKNGVGEWEASKFSATSKELTNEFSRFTKTEQSTLMNLWAIFRSPLMIDGYLPENDEFSLLLITNGDLLEINQQSKNNKVVFQNDLKSVWTATSPDEKYFFLAVFNLSGNVLNEEIELENAGLKGNKLYQMENIWNKKQQKVIGKLDISLEPHASVIFKIKN